MSKQKADRLLRAIWNDSGDDCVITAKEAGFEYDAEYQAELKWQRHSIIAQLCTERSMFEFLAKRASELLNAPCEWRRHWGTGGQTYTWITGCENQIHLSGVRSPLAKGGIVYCPFCSGVVEEANK